MKKIIDISTLITFFVMLIVALIGFIFNIQDIGFITCFKVSASLFILSGSVLVIKYLTLLK